jgi:hypothetical protein
VNPTPIGDCTAFGCDNAIGSFGGVNSVAQDPGTFVIGSINVDTSGSLAGLQELINFLRSGVDGVTNKKLVASPVEINSAFLNVTPIPEPGTASLLGLGIMGLVLAGRRRKA